MKTKAGEAYPTGSENDSISLELNGGTSSWDHYVQQQIPDRNWFGPYVSPVSQKRAGFATLNHKPVVHAYKSEDGSCQVEIIEDEQSFTALEVEWGNLLKDSATNNLFLTWGWLHTWWKHLAEHRTLHIVAVRRDGVLIAIAPLCLRKGIFRNFAPYSTLEFLGLGPVGSDYLDIIVRLGHEQSARQALIKYLTTHKHILTFSQVLSTSSFMAEFAAKFIKNGWLVSRKTTHSCPYITISGHSWDSYLASLGQSHRYNFRRRYKNLQKEFGLVEFEQSNTPAEADQSLAKLIELHNIRWDIRGGSNAFHRPELIRFHGDICCTTLDQKCLKLYTLKLEGKIAAVLYGYKYNNVFYYYQSGFDISLSKHSVGLVIMGLAIKNAIEEGIDKYDFLHGNEEYKFLWASEQTELEQYTLIPPTIKGKVYRRDMSLRSLVKRSIRKMLPQPVIQWLVSIRQSGR